MSDALDMEKTAVCATLKTELERFKMLEVSCNDRGPIRTSSLKIQALCDRLDEIERLEKAEGKQ